MSTSTRSRKRTHHHFYNINPLKSAHMIKTDVMVVGGGLAGVSAAIAARDLGCEVILVEPSNVLGGQGTAGGVAGFCGDSESVNRVFGELVQRLSEHNLIAPYNPQDDRRDYDLEWCAYLLQEMVLERGIQCLLHTLAVDAQAVGGRVTCVTLATADGTLDIEPLFVIDASGRCIVPLKAGFAVEHLGLNKQLPMSLYFTLWDTHRTVRPILPPNCPVWDDDDALPMTTLHYFDSGKVEVKMKVVGFDAADPASLTQAEFFARRQMAGLIYHLLTKGYRGRRYDTYTLASVSRHIGVREARRIVGEHILTWDEITHGSVFDDAVAVGTYHIDFHWPDLMQRAGTGITTMVEPYQIPLRSMIPQNAKNLLVPGRGASGEQMAMSSFRVMTTVSQMGFACGLAAGQCIHSAKDLAQIDMERLQQAIEAGGQSLDLSSYGSYLAGDLTQHEHAFGENRPFPQCHASTLVQLRNNRFLVAYFAGAHEKAPDVGIWASERWQGRWSAPRKLAKVCDQPHWNPVLFKSPAGPLLLYFKVGPTVAAWRTWMMRSDDEGHSWSEPFELLPEDHVARGPVKNKPIILRDGTVLVPGSDERDGVWRPFVDVSHDGGLTFTSGNLLPVSDERITGNGVIQPTLWESRPNHVHMLLRSTCGYVCRADSTDGGRTWSAIYPTELRCINSGIDLVALDSNGSLALVYNPEAPTAESKGAYGPRSPLSVALSFDNGLTWPRSMDLESDKGEYSYPAIIATTRGIAISYTWQRQRVAFWHGSISKIVSSLRK